MDPSHWVDLGPIGWASWPSPEYKVLDMDPNYCADPGPARLVGLVI